MPRYAYRAINQFGTSQKGLQDAASLPDLEARLKRCGLDLITAKIGKRKFALSSSKIKRTDLITFFFNLEQLLRAGVPLLETLADLRDTMSQARFRAIIADLIEAIESGKTFSAAMAQHPQDFDKIFISLTHAGEQSGRLPEVFAHLSASLKWQDEMAAHSKTMLLYPAFVGTIVLGITFFLMIYLVPQLVGFIKSMGQEIPLQTRLLLATSWFFVHFWTVIIFLPILATISAKLAIQSSDEVHLKFDAFKLNLWMVGPILRKIILARFANTFAMM
ncbi:MAG: type II secretion system F family protein, partial [Gallionella sp.]